MVLPHGHKKLIRIMGIHNHIGHPTLFVYKQNLLPALPSIRGFINPSFGMGSPGAPDGSGIYHIRIRGMNDDPVQVPGSLQAHQLPASSAVQALIYPAPAVQTVTGIALTGSGPDHIRIGRINCKRADIGHLFFIKNRTEIDSPIAGLPDTSRGCPHIKDGTITRLCINGCHPSAHSPRANIAGFHTFKVFHIQALGMKRQ